MEAVVDSIVHYGTFQSQAHGKPEGTMVRITAYTSDYVGDLAPCSVRPRLLLRLT